MKNSKFKSEDSLKLLQMNSDQSDQSDILRKSEY
jgi:hypothetical protein